MIFLALFPKNSLGIDLRAQLAQKFTQSVSRDSPLPMNALPYCIFDDPADAISHLRRASPTLSAAEIADICAFLRTCAVKTYVIAQILDRKDYEVRHYVRVGLRLNPDVKPLLHRASLSFGHARVLASYPPQEQEALARKAIALKWSVRELEAKRSDAERLSHADRAYYDQLAERISEQTGYPTTLLPDAANKYAGSMVLRYSSLDEFEGLCKRMRINLSDFDN